MPGPGKKKTKSKTKPRSTTSVPSGMDTFVHEIDNTEGWSVIVSMLCNFFELPDMHRRSGLKKIHANFTEINRKLNEAYTRAQARGNDKIMGGIVGIWAKMSVDVILRDRLFKAGLLSKMMPLLDMRTTRLVGLQALSTVTHHGGVEVRQQIAKETPTLLRIMQELPEDAKVNELIIITITHTAGAVINDDHVETRLMKYLDMPTILRLVFDNIRKPDASQNLISHALLFIMNASRHCHREIKAMPPLVNLLVGCLRSTDLSVRCNSLASIIRLNAADCEQELRLHDPRTLMSALSRRFPPNLSDIMMDYGPASCETTLILRTSADYQKAMMRCAQDKDLYSLGRTLAQLILRTEFSIAEGGFQAYNERTGRPELMDVGLPFKMWTDALPHCAKALRAKGTPEDLDMADIVEIKFYIMRQRIPEGIILAKRGIERNPQVAYFYYAIGLGADSSQALRAVKKGLKAKQITPFVKYYMLWRAVENAGNMGVIMLTSARAGDQDYTEGVAFLMSAYDDAKNFFSEAPPDARHLHTILNWYIILTLAIRGPELSPDLRELDDAFKKLETAREFSEFLDRPLRRTQMRLTRELIVRLYPTATKDWSAFATRLDSLSSHTESEEKATTNAEDNLAAWLDELHIEDEDSGDEHEHNHTHCTHPRINTNTVSLYRCSWCGNPSAILKKCGGCAKTRYCDPSCQKQHWSEHKAVCKAKVSSS